jgi:hypothetical protein
VLVIPYVKVIDGDGTLAGENANQYGSSFMPATWRYMLAARSRGLGTTWTGVTIMSDDEMRPSSGSVAAQTTAHRFSRWRAKSLTKTARKTADRYLR